MPRKSTEQSDIYPYHIWARSNNREWFSLPLDEVYDIYAEVMERTINQYGIRFELFVLMSNHFHAIVSTPEANISQAMRYFMTESSRSIARSSGRINKIYGKRYGRTIIKDPAHYAIVYKYVARNPLAVKTLSHLEEYRWISLNSFRKRLSQLVQGNANGFSIYLPEERGDLMKWIHESFDDDVVLSIKKVLKKKEFVSLKGKNRKYIDLQILLPYRTNALPVQ